MNHEPIKFPDQSNIKDLLENIYSLLLHGDSNSPTDFLSEETSAFIV